MQNVNCLCWLTGVYRSLQQSYNVSSQDVLTAMDYCEESLQEIDITSFLQTLCGHVRVFRERHELHGCVNAGKSSNAPTTFIIGEGEDDGADRATLVSSSRYWPQSSALRELMLCFHCIQILLVFFSKHWAGGREWSRFQRESLCSHIPAGPGRAEVSKNPRIPSVAPPVPAEMWSVSWFTQNHTGIADTWHQGCRNGIFKAQTILHILFVLQDKFMEIGAQYFKTVPSNPHYFFYCLPSSKKEVR